MVSIIPEGSSRPVPHQRSEVELKWSSPAIQNPLQRNINMDSNNLVLEQMAIIDYLTRKSCGAEWNAMDQPKAWSQNSYLLVGKLWINYYIELEQLPSVGTIPSGWEAMDQLLYGVRTDTFSWEALNQPIACVLVPG